MFQAFAECGAAAWVVLFLAVPAVALGVVAVAIASSSPTAARSASIVSLVLVALVAGAGVAGTLVGRATVDRALAHTLSTQREALRKEGYDEARQCTVIAAGADTLPLLLGVAALILSTRSNKSDVRS